MHHLEVNIMPTSTVFLFVFFMFMMMSQKALWDTYKIRIPSTLLMPLIHSFQNIVPERVAKDVVHSDISVNMGGTSFLLAVCNAMFCKPLYEFTDGCNFNSECLDEFFSSKTLFHYWWFMRLWMSLTRQIWLYLKMWHLCRSTLEGEEKPVASWHQLIVAWEILMKF